MNSAHEHDTSKCSTISQVEVDKILDSFFAPMVKVCKELLDKVNREGAVRLHGEVNKIT